MRDVFSYCPICQTILMELPTSFSDNATRVPCDNCGPYALDHAYADGGLKELTDNPTRRAILSHGLRRMAGRDAELVVELKLAEAILRNTELPGAAAQLNNLILFMADELPEPGATMTCSSADIKAVVGSVTDQGAEWVIRQAMDLGYVTRPDGIDKQKFLLYYATLTMKGWMRAEELSVEAGNSKKAFMAMKFGDPELDRVFEECLKPAAKRAGFDLVRLDDAPRAGLIDDRLRLEIRTSRFLIADLSHANAGAYWEAGMAEGLGKPVIYTCRQSVFDDPKTKPHFDTNHYLSILWDSANLNAAADRLVDTIRVTLPSEANLVDV